MANEESLKQQWARLEGNRKQALERDRKSVV